MSKCEGKHPLWKLKVHHEKTKYMIKSWDHIINLLKPFKITVWVSGDMRYTQKLFIDFFVLRSHSKANSRTTTKAGKFVSYVVNVGK